MGATEKSGNFPLRDVVHHGKVGPGKGLAGPVGFSQARKSEIFRGALSLWKHKKLVQFFLLSFFNMGLLFCFPKPSFAWFEVCNYSSKESLSVAFGSYYDHSRRFPGGDGEDFWESSGWWIIERGDCKIVYEEDLENRYNYVYVSNANYSEGDGPSRSFCVTDRKFAYLMFPEDENEPCSSKQEAVSRYSRPDPKNPKQFIKKDFIRIDTGRYATNFTLKLQ